ncbi:MAG: hypothetical protein ACTSRU_13240, partial [Candidatus Hodarchaeales archaeon]
MKLSSLNHQWINYGVIILFLFQISSLCFVVNGTGSFLIPPSIQEKNGIIQEEKDIDIRLLDETLPYSVKGAGIGSNGSHFFLFGGTVDLLSGRRNIIIADYQTFESIENSSVSLPSPVHDMGYIQVENKVYLIGGAHYNDFSKRILCFDLATQQFDTVASELPTGLVNPKLVIIEGDIYILCGKSSSGVNDRIYKYIPGEDSLTTLSMTTPSQLADPIVHWTGSEILLIGGNFSSTPECSNEIWSVDPIKENVYKLETSLPFPLKSSSYIPVDSRIYTFDNFNSTVPISTALEIDTETLDVKVLKNELLLPCQHSFTVGCDDFYLYLFGGIINQSETSVNSIIQVDLNLKQDKTLFQQPHELTAWDLTEESSFDGNNSIEWSTTSNPCVAKVDFNRNTVTHDCLELEVRYDSHSDINTRQAVNIGWTDSTSFSRTDGSNLSNNPAGNFVGISIRNSLSFILLSSQVVKNNRLIFQNDYYLTPNMTHCIRLQVWLTNQSYFFQTITVDGEVTALEYIQGNLTGISFVDFAIWNQNISTQDIQGRYTGELLFSRYLENVTSPHIQTWFTVDVQDEEEIILSNPGFFTGMLFLSFFLILLIIVAIASPIIFKLLIKKKISDEITGEMVDQMSFIKEDMDVAELKSYPHISANLRVLYKL